MSQSSSALLLLLDCVLNKLGVSTDGASTLSCIFFAVNFKSWTQKSYFFEIKAHALRVTKGGGWLVGWAYGLLFVMHVMVKKWAHPLKVEFLLKTFLNSSRLSFFTFDDQT